MARTHAPFSAQALPIGLGARSPRERLQVHQVYL
jgi:hypothetical protein